MDFSDESGDFTGDQQRCADAYHRPGIRYVYFHSLQIKTTGLISIVVSMKKAVLILPLLAFAGLAMAGNRRESPTIDLGGDEFMKACEGANGRWKRNNNPGNIRLNSANDWKGKRADNTDGQYEQFESMVWGARAMLRVLLTYIGRGQNTISLIVKQYAPPIENNTAKYIAYVSQRTGLGSNTQVKPEKETLRAILKAMVRVETGCEAMTDDLFEQAWRLRQ